MLTLLTKVWLKLVEMLFTFWAYACKKDLIFFVSCKDSWALLAPNIIHVIRCLQEFTTASQHQLKRPTGNTQHLFENVFKQAKYIVFRTSSKLFLVYILEFSISETWSVYIFQYMLFFIWKV